MLSVFVLLGKIFLCFLVDGSLKESLAQMQREFSSNVVSMVTHL